MNAAHTDPLCVHDLVWDAPPACWSEGAPLGNGRVGAVAWVEGDELVLSVDHADNWDRTGLTPPAGTVTWAGFRAATAPGTEPGGARDDHGTPGWPEQFPIERPRTDVNRPTRLPASTVRISLSTRAHSMRLCLTRATLEINTGSSSPILVRVPAGTDVVHVDGTTCSYRLIGCTEQGPDLPPDIADLVKTKNYPAPRVEPSLFVQSLPDRSEAAVAVHVERDQLSIGLAYGHDGQDAAATATAAAAGGASHVSAHERSWQQHWAASGIELDDPVLMRLWARQTYLLGAATAPDGRTITLQGPWSTPHRLPAWGNDLHYNVNLQMSYWPVASGSRHDLMRPLWEHVRAAMPYWRSLCQDLFGVPGAFVPHDSDNDGRPLWDWALPFFAASSGPWLALQLLDAAGAANDQQRHDEALTWLAELIAPLLAQLEPDETGTLHLPWGFSPEYVDVTGSWGPDTTIDLEVLRAALDRLLQHRPDAPDAARWQQIRAHLAHPAADEGAGALGAVLGLPPGGLRVRADAPLTRSHRHHSHLIGVHPLRIREVDDSVVESLMTLIRHGHGEWVGFSLPWAAGIAHACHRPNLAAGLLRDFADDWLTGNGFQFQGSDCERDLTIWNELMKHLPDALTLEAGFGATAVLQEILLSETRGVVHLCTDLPTSWRNLSFHGLAVPCGIRADAVVRDGQVVSATLTAGRDTDLRLRLAACQPTATRLTGPADISRDGADVRTSLRAGQALHLTLTHDDPHDDPHAA